MKRLPMLFVLFVLVMIEQKVLAQIGDLTEIEGAKKRLDKYLLDADEGTGRRGCLIFRISLVTVAADATAEVTKQSETIGIQFHDLDKRRFYSSNHVSTVGSALPRRSEMFRINGKEKGKLYGVGRENANGQVIEILPDKDGSRADWNNAGVLSGAHTELDAYSLPVLNSIAIEGRLSSVDGAVRMWLTVFDFVSEETKDNKLNSRWVSKKKDLVNELVFDQAQGGMPVSTREYSIDAKGKQTKAYLSETKTTWKKLKGDDERWVPESLESIYSDKTKNRNYTVDLDWIEVEKLDEWVSEVNWKTLFDEPTANWYGNISRLILEKRMRDKGKAAPARR